MDKVQGCNITIVNTAIRMLPIYMMLRCKTTQSDTLDDCYIYLIIWIL